MRVDWTSKLSKLRSAITGMVGQSAGDTDTTVPEASAARLFWRNAGVNFSLGCACMFLLLLTPAGSVLEAQEQRAVDWLVRIYSGVDPVGYAWAPFVFLEIDETTYRDWGEPMVTPRDHLARLIALAVRSEAALALVDFDLSRRGGVGDDDLVLELERLGSAEGTTQIVFARTFRDPFPPSEKPWREARESFLDSQIEAAGNMHWASTLFLQDADGRIRRFRNFEPTCRGGRSHAVPAFQLLAAALLVDAEKGRETLDTALASLPSPCSDGPTSRGAGERTAPAVTIGDMQIPLEGSRLSSRILYSFGSDQSSVPYVDFKGRRVPLLTRIPVHSLSAVAAPDSVEILRDRIVVIGASFRESRDLHATPLGAMPGALILSNALYSLLQQGGLKPPRPAVVLSAQMLLLAVVSLIFAPPILKATALLAPVVTVLLLLPFSFWMFSHGLWLDFVLPVAAVQVQAALRSYARRYIVVRDQVRRARKERQATETET